ncbi:hypothetical protein VTK56DRAFT_1187 [Thermocarpiscus australiensis]
MIEPQSNAMYDRFLSTNSCQGDAVSESGISGTSSLYLTSTLPEPLQPRPPCHQTPRPQRIYDHDIHKTKHQTPTKNKTVVRLRIALVQIPHLAHNRPRQNIQQITCQALVQIPLRPRRQHNAR